MKVIVIGPRGKMGKLITQVAAERDDMELVAGVAPACRDYVGQDLGMVALIGRNLGVPVVDDLAAVIDDCDVIIDFSTRENALKVLDLAVKHGKALVCGTTGFSKEEFARFKEAAKTIPMLYAANTSKLVNIMNKLLEMVTKTLGEDADIEILEMHDQWKKDAPSGTSKEMGEIMAHAMGKELSDIAVYGREGESPREKVIFRAAIRYFSDAWVNAWRSHITPITGNVLQEEPATVRHIWKIKVLDSIAYRMC